MTFAILLYKYSIYVKVAYITFLVWIILLIFEHWIPSPFECRILAHIWMLNSLFSWNVEFRWIWSNILGISKVCYNSISLNSLFKTQFNLDSIPVFFPPFSGNLRMPLFGLMFMRDLEHLGWWMWLRET